MPKKKQFRRRSRANSAPPTVVLSRPSKRKQWTEEQMLSAIEAVRKGMAANKAAMLHGIPRSTLKDRLSGRVRHGTKPGPHPYLQPSEEKELVEYLRTAARIGYGKTRREVKSIAENVAIEKGMLKAARISNGWWRRFMERNPSLRLRRGDATAGVRLDAVNADNIRGYYALLKEIYDEFDFESHPERVYNMDETGVPLDPRPPKVIAAKGQKKVRYRSSGNKSQITVVGCGSATGQAIPPFIIFAAKQLNELWTRDEVSGSRFAVSDSGWIDQELFFYWLRDHFMTNAVAARPLLLLLDGHSSHYEPASVRFAKENGIILFCLPPHTTHECQPLDCSLFGPLKVRWRQVVHDFYRKNPGQVVSKLNFCSIFRQAWLKAVTPDIVCAGFRKAGVIPYNPDAVSLSGNTGGPEVGAGGATSRESESGGAGGATSRESESGGAGGATSRESESGGAGGATSRESESGGAGGATSREMESGGSGGATSRESESGGAGEATSRESESGGAGGATSRESESGGSGGATSRESESGGAGGATSRESESGGAGGATSRESESGGAGGATSRETESGGAGGATSSETESGDAGGATSSETESGGAGGATSRESESGGSGGATSRESESGGAGGATSRESESGGAGGATSSETESGDAGGATSSIVSKFLAPLPTRDDGGDKGKKTRARVLTRAEILTELEEKAEKKKREAKEKEKRKEERQRKKKLNEDKKRQKAEERAKKEKEKAAKKARQEKEKAEKKSKKAEEKSKKAEEQSRQMAKRARKRSVTNIDPQEENVRTKKARLGDIQSNIDSNTCCACFGDYADDTGTGREWLQCQCGRWIHEDCVEECMSESVICPLCLSAC